MPGKDGTGPSGFGPGSGRGNGYGRNHGRQGGYGPDAGITGSCVCPACGEKITHRQGVPCYKEHCPKCGTKMIRGE
ncbi:MAG: hypothetical protein JW969_16050 [Spirochaetales bacterium]|nr:hypothetical protein [Spirochaetales bacterium]